MRSRSSISSPKKEERGRPEVRLDDFNGPKSAPANMQDISNDGKQAEETEDENATGVFDDQNSSTSWLLTRKDTTQKPTFAQGNTISIIDKTNAHIALPNSPSHATPIGTVSNIHHSVVDMSILATEHNSFASLTLKSATESLILCGNVSGPAHVTGLEKCVIFVASRQLRMHDCKDCDVYLHCSSRPIIERCEGISFAPLPDNYVSA